MPAKRNLDSYIEQKVQRELERNILNIIERKVSKAKVNTLINNWASQTQHKAIRNFGRAMFGGNEYTAFGTTSSQLSNAFVAQIQHIFS
ncbi:MAG: hypothetical protein K0R73_460 [Candidatus Midichloriaceae bacterium]|jgi:coproporphyrinogen III oxidase-like Fe-S oxidoreductase|nr:hypothetical protein [Candidatus Midichloriaceae bacterium]